MKIDETLEEWMREPLSKFSAVESAVNLTCGRCRSEWLGPPEADDVLRHNLAEWYRAAKVLDAFEALKNAGFAFRDAKPTLLHISRHPGTCHRCGRSISPAPGSVVCRCKCLNLNW